MSETPQHGHGQAPRDPVSDRMVTPERSVFGTRLPRPTGVGRHLLVVLVVAILALAIAVGFAERDTGEAVPSETRRFTTQTP